MRTVLLMEMTTKEVKEYLYKEDKALIPLGSCEQHGVHCPLGTDSFITQEVSKRVAEKLNLIVAPLIPVGLSDQHLPWQGTISLKVKTIRHILFDYVDSLFCHGFRRIILHYFHTKNKIAADAAAWEIKKRYGDKIKIMVVNSFASWAACAEEIFGPDYDKLWAAHGGEGETACLMALGFTIDKSNIPQRYENREFLESSRSPEAYSMIQNLKGYVPEGTWGEPGRASRETGEKILETITNHLAQLIPKQWEK